MANQALQLLPAIDIASGQAVRLTQGRAGSETQYGSPADVAMVWQKAGAELLHLVDLDAAFGRGANDEAIEEVMSKVSIKVEISGGIRDDQSLRKALQLGATRVNIGTAALENPTWVAHAIDRYGDKIAVALDVQGNQLAARGWTRESGPLWETLQYLETVNCPRYVVTDVTKDGTMRGPNIALMRDILSRSRAPIIASGGIASLTDLENLYHLVPLGLEGAIIGKALYEHRFTLAEALAATEKFGS